MTAIKNPSRCGVTGFLPSRFTSIFRAPWKLCIKPGLLKLVLDYLTNGCRLGVSTVNSFLQIDLRHLSSTLPSGAFISGASMTLLRLIVEAICSTTFKITDFLIVPHNKVSDTRLC